MDTVKNTPETKKDWWKESVIYQIYPRSFADSNGDGIGDLNGITEKLDYLKDLGVDLLWLSPIYASPNADMGYDISDYRAIMSEFGTMEDFDRMLEEAHKRGIKIMMDLVVNHTSDEHRWFEEARKSKDNPYRDYYIWRPGHEDGTPPNNWGSFFSGSAWSKTPETDEYYLHLFAEKQPDLNWDNPKLRQAVYDMMKFWLDKGVDGFRMDVISLISKVPGLPDGVVHEGAIHGDGSPYYTNGPHEHEYLKEMNREVLSKYDIATVGETPGVSVEDAQRYTGPDENELNMVFQFEMMGLDQGEFGKWSPKKLDLRDLKAFFKRWQEGLDGKGWNSLFWDNHDQPRIVSRYGNDKEYREDSAKMLALCLHMHQGTPYIFQGEELGMTNVDFPTLDHYRDIEILNAHKELVEDTQQLTHEEFMVGVHAMGRDNARTPMQWDDSPNAGFTTGTPWIDVNPNYKEINAKAEMEKPGSVRDFYKQLIKLRHEYPIIPYGHYELLLPEDENIYMFTRELDGEKLLVICNFSDEIHDVEVPDEFLEAKLLISNQPEHKIAKTMHLQPWEGSAYYLGR